MEIKVNSANSTYIDFLHIFSRVPTPLFLPPKSLQLPIPQRRKRDAGKRNAEPDPQVSAIVAQLPRQRARPPDLIHAHDRPDPADQERDKSGEPNGQPRPVLPCSPVEANVPAEDGVLLKHDRDEDGEPVAHEGEEVLEDEEQVVAARDGADEVNDRRDRGPDVPGNRLPHPPEDLEVERRRVRARDLVGAEAERDDDGAELAEAAQTAVTGKDEGARGDGVGVGPGWGGGDAAGQADAEEVYEDERDSQAGQGHQEDLPLGHLFGEVDEEV